MADDDDEVGYGKPPRGHQFKPGQSGNPNGRRARPISFDALLEQQLDKKVSFSTKGRKVQISTRQAVVMKLVNDALSGKTRAQEIVLKLMRENSKPDPFRAKPYDNLIFDDLVAQLAPPDDDSEPEEK